jgi:hypothetical protein
VNGAASLVPFGTKDRSERGKNGAACCATMPERITPWPIAAGARAGLWCGGGFFGGEEAGEVTLLEGADAVAELGSFLELEFLRGFTHLTF